LTALYGYIVNFIVFLSILSAMGNDAVGTLAIPSIIMVISTGLVAIIALIGYGIRIFWGSGMAHPRLYISEVLPIGILLVICVLLTLFPGQTLSYLERTSDELHRPELYIESVLSAAIVG